MDLNVHNSSTTELLLGDMGIAFADQVISLRQIDTEPEWGALLICHPSLRVKPGEQTALSITYDVFQEVLAHAQAMLPVQFRAWARAIDAVTRQQVAASWSSTWTVDIGQAAFTGDRHNIVLRPDPA